ncbi:hypothetical protein GJAV_G00048480 [Gymnothorax javanicus]|nr:hypothetical protein GJAV_G00048480 [Gymnothorax javanicus]
MIIFCLGVLLIAIRTEAFTVLGPAVPLVVQTGKSVTLPCSADTPLPTLGLEVRWMREDSGSIVHAFQEGESRSESQSPSYRGRAEFFSEEISKGNFSLLLMNVTSKDKGLYKCVVFSDRESRETTVRIDVERLTVTGAVEPVLAYAGEDVILNCTVDTHVPVGELLVQWIKMDGEILVLLFDEGESRPESQDERFRGRAEFFSEEIPKGNFSMKLRDVKTEDRGEFMCRVDTDIESVHVSAWLQEQGFSSLNLCVLGLTFAAAVIAVLSCIPAVLCIKRGREKKESKPEEVELRKRSTNGSDAEEEESSTKKGTNGKRNRAGWLYCLQVSVPCILLSIAFVIWGVIEGSVGEACICSALNLMRILVIFKVAPYELPGKCFERLTLMALPLEIFGLTTGVNSVVLDNFLTHRGADTTAKVMNGLFFGILSFRSLSAVGSSGLGISSGYTHIRTITDYEVFFLVFTRSTFGFTAVFLIWFIVPGLRNSLAYWKTDLSGSRYAHLLDKSLETLMFIFECAIYLLLLGFILDKDKEHLGILCFMAFLYIIKAIIRFKHRSDLPDLPHILVYVFGSAGLSVLNSVALATEVFLKAEKGQRTVEDLRGVILILESLFFVGWLGLQIYAFCNQDKKLKEQLELRFPCCKKPVQPPASSQKDQAQQQAVEKKPLSSSEQSTSHRQERMQMGEELKRLSQLLRQAAHKQQVLQEALERISQEADDK